MFHVDCGTSNNEESVYVDGEAGNADGEVLNYSQLSWS